jgi:transposase
MLNLSPGATIYWHTGPTDMRKGIDGLSGIVRGEFDGDPLDGSLYLFINRRRDRMKILHWDGGGFWIYYRVLEQGTFAFQKSADKRLVIDATQLAMLLGGVSLVGVNRRKRYRRSA